MEFCVSSRFCSKISLILNFTSTVLSKKAFVSIFVFIRWCLVHPRNPQARPYGLKNLYPSKKAATVPRKLTKSIDFCQNYLCDFHLRREKHISFTSGTWNISQIWAQKASTMSTGAWLLPAWGKRGTSWPGKTMWFWQKMNRFRPPLRTWSWPTFFVSLIPACQDWWGISTTSKLLADKEASWTWERRFLAVCPGFLWRMVVNNILQFYVKTMIISLKGKAKRDFDVVDIWLKVFCFVFIFVVV